jgi:hypothetical protein
MNVFEDLIEELREENLLEDTVIDLRKESAGSGPSSDVAEGLPTEAIGHRSGPAGGDVPDQDPEFSAADAADEERDFYRKRAIDEISSLQMVEHILSGIEREHLKVVPASYDDLEAKKALHRFLQVQSEPNTTEYAEAEFRLMHETESWSTALAERDARASVSSLRRFCENSRPVLSSQALMALGRFYRNASYSELSRSKFDLVMTRLFSRDGNDEKRRLLFSRGDMIGHIKTLYANWSSVALYRAESDSIKIRAVVAGFDDRVSEIEKAETFDQLIHNSFFDKVHEFKEATGEMFFTPQIVAAAIDSNIRIGNKFIDLIRFERERTTLEGVEQKYGYEYDQIISAAAGKTLLLVDVLKSARESDNQDSAPVSAPTIKLAAEKKEKTPLFSSDMFRVNKWLLAATVLAVISSVGLFVWSSDNVTESTGTESAKSVEIENPELTEFLRSGRSTAETFYAITLPAWDQLPEEKKKEVLQKAGALASQKGLPNVRLVSVRGDLEAFSSKTRSEILHPIP